MGDARGGGLVRGLVGGAGRAALALRAADRGAGGVDRAASQHLHRPHRGGGVARLSPPPEGGGDEPRLSHRRLPVARRAGEGVEVVVVESPDGIGVPVEAIARAVDDRTALVATSHVFFTSGAIQDVAGRGRGRAPRRARCCWWTATRRRASCRWTCARSTSTSTAAAGSSGCSAARGVAFMYARPELWPTLAPARERVVRAPRAVPVRPARRWSSTTMRAGSRPARRRCMPVYAQLGGLEVIEELGARGDPPAHHGAGRGPDRAGPRARGSGRRWPPTPEERTGIVMLPSDDPARRRPPAGGGGHRRRQPARPRARLALLLQRRRTTTGPPSSD